MFYVSFAGRNNSLGLNRAGLGCGLGLRVVTPGLNYNTDHN